MSSLWFRLSCKHTTTLNTTVLPTELCQLCNTAFQCIADSVKLDLKTNGDGTVLAIGENENTHTRISLKKKKQYDDNKTKIKYSFIWNNKNYSLAAGLFSPLTLLEHLLHCCFFFTAVSVFKCNLTLQLDRLCARSYSTTITVRNNDLHTGMNCLDE